MIWPRKWLSNSANQSMNMIGLRNKYTHLIIHTQTHSSSGEKLMDVIHLSQFVGCYLYSHLWMSSYFMKFTSWNFFLDTDGTVCFVIKLSSIFVQQGIYLNSWVIEVRWDRVKVFLQVHITEFEYQSQLSLTVQYIHQAATITHRKWHAYTNITTAPSQLPNWSNFCSKSNFRFDRLGEQQTVSCALHDLTHATLKTTSHSIRIQHTAPTKHETSLQMNYRGVVLDFLSPGWRDSITSRVQNNPNKSHRYS